MFVVGGSVGLMNGSGGRNRWQGVSATGGAGGAAVGGRGVSATDGAGGAAIGGRGVSATGGAGVAAKGCAGGGAFCGVGAGGGAVFVLGVL